jgi:hypothetical protein
MARPANFVGKELVKLYTYDLETVGIVTKEDLEYALACAASISRSIYS